MFQAELALDIASGFVLIDKILFGETLHKKMDRV